MEEVEHPCIAFVHSLNNERDTHMCGPAPKMDVSVNEVLLNKSISHV